MLYSELSSNNAFIPGSDLWIVPSFAHSKWAYKVDWYLGFQMNKMIHMQFQELSEEVNEILKNEEFEALPKYHCSPECDRLFVTSKKLPNQYVMQMNYSDDIDQWLQTGISKAEDLKVSSARFFLPVGTSLDIQSKLEKIKIDPDFQCSLVRDLGL
ncbi:MAG: hypothetical protein AB8E15_04355 [Bdellovibrionales bacterium]